MWRFLYRIFILSYGVLLLGYLFPRRKLYGERWLERLWKLPQGAPKRALWVHAVSFGEVKAIEPFLKKWRENHPEDPIILSTMTHTGFKEASKWDFAFFLPLDLPFLMRLLIRHLEPRLLLIMESDFWNEQLRAAKEAGIPIALINGKLSESSCKRYLSVKNWSKELFSCFDLLLLQSEEYAKRFRLFVDTPLEVTGNLKWEMQSPPLTEEEKQGWRESLQLDDRPVLILASTHAPEEELLRPALERLQKRVRCLLVPRHIERAPALRAMYAKSEVTIIDRMGILRQLYQLATIAFVGGSLTDKVGGHNLLEPIAAGAALLTGPYLYGQREMQNVLKGVRGYIEVTPETVESVVITLLEHPKERQAMLARARQLFGHSHPLEKSYDALNLLVVKRAACVY